MILKKLKIVVCTTFFMTVLALCGFTYIMAYASSSNPELAKKTEDPSAIFDNINLTKYSQKSHFETIDGGNYFSWGRIDVADDNGYAYQAFVFICEGTESYVENFNQELEQLAEAYSDNQGKITGYLDLIRDNRLRNYGEGNFSTIEKVEILSTNGVQYDAYVIAVCGAEDFIKPYDDFLEKIIGEYYNKAIAK